jgi:tRNA pseudouridine13 synthase
VIKSVPTDFIVEEQADLPLHPSGGFRVYVLEKSGWTTPDLIRRISRAADIPLSRVAYGGKKDKHGLTSQFITVEDPRDLGQRGEDFSLRAVGFMDRPMGPDLIRENAFMVTIRDLPDTDPFEHNAEDVRRSGFPNFFDDQRFRSYDPERGFFAEKILKRHWNGALQVYLTSAAHSAKKEQGRLAAIFESWKDWPACLRLAREPLEKNIFEYLAAHPRDFRGALRLLPEDEVAMRYAAFQSHLWNELLRRLLRLKIEALEEVRGSDGAYLFWRSLDPGTLGYLAALEIPTAAAKPGFRDDLTATFYADILREAGLSPGAFRTKELRRVSFRSFLRRALLLPHDLKIIKSDRDELHPGRKKLTLSFSLPRGAYGTMLIKRLGLARATGRNITRVHTT